MDFLANLALGFSVALTPFNLLHGDRAACVIGILIGALPGDRARLGRGAAAAAHLRHGARPPGSSCSPRSTPARMYGGTITSVLINTPGESASVVTCIDGYQMALQGRAGPALGIAAIGSFIAGTVGVVLLMLMSPLLARWALSFGPPETFALMLLGLTTVTGCSPASSALKGYISMVLGLMLAMVGFDIISGDAALRLRHRRDDGRRRLPAGRDRPVRHGRGAGRRRGGRGRRKILQRALRPARRAADRGRLGAQPLGDRARHRARLPRRHAARRRADGRDRSSPTPSRRRSRSTPRSSATARSRASPAPSRPTTPPPPARWCRCSRSASPARPPPRSCSAA